MRFRLYTTGRLVGLALAACLLIVGCRKPPPPPSTTPQPPTAQAPAAQSVAFAYQDRVADALSIIAVEKGLLDEEELEVVSFSFSNGPECSEALTLHTADVGTMGDTTAVMAVAKAPVKIIASHGGGEDRHRIIVAEDSELKTVADLRGKRVAVKHGTSTHGGLLTLLAATGMEPADLELVDMRPPDMIDALIAGSIGAMVASEPTPSLAEAAGGRELATLGGLDNSYPILLLAREELLAEHPETVAAFLRAMRRAEELLESEPEECARVLSEVTGLEPDVLKRAMDHHYFRLNLDETTVTSLEGIAEFLHDQGLLEAEPDIEAGLHRAALEELAAGG
jgi:aliphatic sulfonates family ABC transporter substrate-binding protein